jgi:hypothetical protein
MILVLILALFVGTLDVYAGGQNRRGTAGAQELLIPVGARGIALGNSVLSTVTGLDAIHYNPAGLSAATGNAEALFSSMNYIADIGVSYFAAGVHFSGFGSLAVSVKSVGFGDIAYTDEVNTEGTGQVFSPSFITFGLTYSRALTDRIRAGITTKLVTEKIMSTSASGLVIDAGLQYANLGGVRGLTIGVALKNFGPAMQFDGSDLYRTAHVTGADRPDQPYKVEAATFEMPSSLEIGFGYEATVLEKSVAVISGTYQNNNYSNDEYRVGLEYSYDNMLFLRGAYIFAGDVAAANLTDTPEFIYGASVGAGVNLDLGGVGLGVDYAYRTTRIFTGNNVFTVKVKF